MFISKLPNTDSDRRSTIISWAGSQTQETDECRPSLKRNQVVKDLGRKIAGIIPFIKYFSVF